MTESLNFESFNAVLYNSLDWTSDLILPITASLSICNSLSRGTIFIKVCQSKVVNSR